MIKKKELKALMLNMLIIDGNETNLISIDGQNKYRKLLIAVTKSYYDIRFCSYKKCQCHPENEIKLLMKDKELSEFLKDNKLYDILQEYIKDYSPNINNIIYER